MIADIYQQYCGIYSSLYIHLELSCVEARRQPAKVAAAAAAAAAMTEIAPSYRQFLEQVFNQADPKKQKNNVYNSNVLRQDSTCTPCGTVCMYVVASDLWDVATLLETRMLHVGDDWLR